MGGQCRQDGRRAEVCMALLAFVLDAPSPRGLDADRSRPYHCHDDRSFDSTCRHALIRPVRPGAILPPWGVTGEAVPVKAGAWCRTPRCARRGAAATARIAGCAAPLATAPTGQGDERAARWPTQLGVEHSGLVQGRRPATGESGCCVPAADYSEGGGLGVGEPRSRRVTCQASGPPPSNSTLRHPR